MRTARRGVSPSLLVGVLAAMFGCTEDIASPGACPAFCPDAEIVVRDTLLTAVVERDSSYFGYVSAFSGRVMPVTSAGSGVRSHAVLEFTPFLENILFDSTSVVRADIVSTDSFRLELKLLTRNQSTSGLEVLVFALPVGNDSSTTFAMVDSVIAAGPMIGVGAVPDTIVRDSAAVSDSISLVFPASGLPTYEADGRTVALAVSVRSAAGPTYAEFGTREAQLSARLHRYATVDSSGTPVVRRDNQTAAFDTFVSEAAPAPGSDQLIAGDTPASRALLRFLLPPAIMDSTTVVGATLYLVPVAPTIGAPQDTFELQANALSADFGAKSPIVLIISSAPEDSASFPAANVPVGSMDTIRVNVTPILRNWQSSGRPHSMIIRVSPEGGTIGAVLFGSSGHPTASPALRITYVNPFRFEGR